MDLEQLKKQLEEAMKKIQTLETELADAKKAKAGTLDDDERKRLQHLEAENKTLIDARDKAKDKARKEEEERLKQAGEYKKLYDTQTADLEASREQTKTLQATIDGYTQRDETELAELLKQIPENLRDDFADDVPLSRRLSMARKIAGKAEIPPYRKPGENLEGIKTKADFLNNDEKAAFIKKHGSAAYLKLPDKIGD